MMRYTDTNERIPYDQEVIAWILINIDTVFYVKVVMKVERVDEYRCSHDYSYDQYQYAHCLYKSSEDIRVELNRWFEDGHGWIFTTEEALREFAINSLQTKMNNALGEISRIKETLKQYENTTTI